METTEKLDFLRTLLPLAGIIFIIAVGVVLLTQQFHKNQYRQRLQQEELKNHYQVELLKSSIEVQENERKHIAQDIHDELGAVLSIARMHLVQLEDNEKDKTGNLLPALQNIRSLTETAISSMRRISHQLMPQQLEAFGLVKTLEAVAAQANKTGSIAVHILAANDLPELTWPVKLGLYRINMELMNNTFKHAGANTITIRLDDTGNYITCTYTDDGKGFQDQPGIDGFGHKSIEGRSSSLGGTCTFSDSSAGFKAVIKIPVVA